MANAGLRRTDSQLIGPASGPTIDRHRLSAVVQRRSCPMRINISDLRRSDTADFARLLHRDQRGITFRMRLRQVMAVRGGSVTADFRHDLCAPFPGGVK